MQRYFRTHTHMHMCANAHLSTCIHKQMLAPNSVHFIISFLHIQHIHFSKRTDKVTNMKKRTRAHIHKHSLTRSQAHTQKYTSKVHHWTIFTNLMYSNCVKYTRLALTSGKKEGQTKWKVTIINECDDAEAEALYVDFCSSRGSAILNCAAVIIISTFIVYLCLLLLLLLADYVLNISLLEWCGVC